MDLTFSQADIDFQMEVRQWIEDNYPQEMRSQKAFTGGSPQGRSRVLAAGTAHQGWSAPGWPVEYGGPGFTPTQRYLFDLEMARAGTRILFHLV